MYYKPIIIFTMVLFLFNCGVPPINPSPPESKIKKIEKEMELAAKKIIDNGGLAVFEFESSVKRGNAEAKAKIKAQVTLSQIFGVAVQSLSKRFVEELGSDFEIEINEAFSSASKIITDEHLEGAMPRKSDYVSVNSKQGIIYHCYVLLAIDGTMQLLLKEVENKNKNLYERMRMTDAMQELEEEIEKNRKIKM